MDTTHFSDLFLNFSAFIHLNLGGFSCNVFFLEKSRSNVCEKYWLTKDCSGGFMNPLHNPRNEHSKTEFGKKNSEKMFGESEEQI